jgi:hypothetical protein
MVKSQFGLAVSAVVTVVSSLLMSLSLCYFFGLNPTLNGRCVFVVFFACDVTLKPYGLLLLCADNVFCVSYCLLYLSML